MIIAAIVVVTIIAVQQVRDLAAIVDVLILGVALAVAAVPEGLLAVVSAGMRWTPSAWHRRHAIVRKLPVVETLGSATQSPADKAGRSPGTK